MDKPDIRETNCPYPRNRDECLAELSQLKGSVNKWNLILEDIYKAIVGDIHGNMGLQSKVKTIEEEIVSINTRLLALEKFVNSSPDRAKLKDVISKVDKIDPLLEEIIPETKDSHDKKMIIRGMLMLLGVSGGIITAIAGFHKYILPLFKISP